MKERLKFTRPLRQPARRRPLLSRPLLSPRASLAFAGLLVALAIASAGVIPRAKASEWRFSDFFQQAFQAFSNEVAFVVHPLVGGDSGLPLFVSQPTPVARKTPGPGLSTPDGASRAPSLSNEVLGTHTAIPPETSVRDLAQPTGLVLTRRVEALLDQYLAEGRFVGSKGDKGDKGDAGTVTNSSGQTTVVVGGYPLVTYYPPVPASGFQGGSMAAFTNLSSNSFITGKASVTDSLTVSGGSSFSGAALFAGPAAFSGAVTLATTTINGSLTVNGNTYITQGGLLNVGDKIISPGEIGLGTTTPAAKLAIQNTLPLQTAFLIYGTSTQTSPLIDVVDSPASNNNLFRLTADGSIGIGTTTPAQKLVVAGNARITGSLYDSSAFAGNSGYVLQSSGVGTQWVATSSLGIAAGITSLNGLTGPSQAFATSTSGGLDLLITSSGSTHTFALQPSANYTVPLAASTTAWSLFYTVPSTRIAAGTGLSWSGSTLNASNAFTGSGAGGYVARWASSTGLTSGSLLDNGASVGVNATSSSYTFNIQGSPAVDPFNIASSTGESLFVVNQSGYVGIGTTTPSDALNVYGDNRFLALQRATTTAGTGLRLKTGATNDWYVGLRDTLDSDFHLFSYGMPADAMTILKASGNVGIATLTPAARLDVNTSAVDYKVAQFIQGATSNTGASPAVTIAQSHATNSSALQINFTGAGGDHATYANTAALEINNTTGQHDSINVRNNATSQFVVKTDGRVGIGTTSPSRLLDIAGGSAASGEFKALRLYHNGTNINDNISVEFAPAGGYYNIPSKITAVADGNGSYFQFWQQSGGVLSNALGMRVATPAYFNTNPTDNIGTYGLDFQTGASNAVQAYLRYYLGSGYKSTLQFGTTNSNNAATTKMVIDNIGNVGIGTTTPTLGPLTMGSGAYVTTGGTWTNASDRNLKEHFASITPADVLQKIGSLPITQWNYKAENASITHIGPTAQDFYAAFGLGGEAGKTSISTIDPAGVALLGIKALNEKIAVLQGGLTGNITAPTLSMYVPYNFSGDSVGEARILTGQTSVRIRFSQAYAHQPIVTVTAEDFLGELQYRVTAKENTGFTVELNATTTTDLTFDWHSFASPDEQLTVSDGTIQPIVLSVTTRPGLAGVLNVTLPADVSAATSTSDSALLTVQTLTAASPTPASTETPVSPSASTAGDPAPAASVPPISSSGAATDGSDVSVPDSAALPEPAPAPQATSVDDTSPATASSPESD